MEQGKQSRKIQSPGCFRWSCFCCLQYPGSGGEKGGFLLWQCWQCPGPEARELLGTHATSLHSAASTAACSDSPPPPVPSTYLWQSGDFSSVRSVCKVYCQCGGNDPSLNVILQTKVISCKDKRK